VLAAIEYGQPISPAQLHAWHLRHIAQAARTRHPGVNLKRAFVAAMLEHIDAGWELGEFSSTGGVFFCDKGVERRQVEITPSDPGQPRFRGKFP